jgi:hypothetical protein
LLRLFFLFCCLSLPARWEWFAAAAAAIVV